MHPNLPRWLAMLVALVTVGVGSATTLAAPSDPDPAWGTNGVVTSLGGATQVVGLKTLANGGTLVAIRTFVDGVSRSRVIRLDASGQVDGGFAGTGAIEPRGLPDALFGGMAVQPDGRISVLWQGRQWQLSISTVVCDRVLGRYLPSGLPDASFGTQGEVPHPFSSCGFGHVLDSQGSSYGFSNHTGFSPVTFLIRHAADGSSVLTVPPFAGPVFGYDSLTIDPADRLVVGLYRRDGAQQTLAVGRTGTPAFGTSGIGQVELPGPMREQGAFGFADGRVTAFGASAHVSPDGAWQPVIVRLASNGLRDVAFGNDGLVILPLAKFGEYGAVRVHVHALPDERLVVVADIQLAGSESPSRVVVARLLADGRLDATFARGGVAELALGDARLASGLPAILAVADPASRPTGEMALPLSLRDAAGAETPAVLQLKGGDLAQPAPFATRRAVEYFHAGYGHYFISADADEIAHLDATPSTGWERTGKAFDVFAGDSAPLAPVCRFWSDQTFAPKSSHFYTPYAAECDTVKAGADWRFERNAFELRLPVGATGSMTCPTGTVPLYRAFNNMTTGAPNHRYTNDPAVLDAMIAQGWTMEGEAATRVFACLPPQ